MRIDVNAAIGSYPFRDVGPWSAAHLLAEMVSAGVSEAWVSHLTAAFWRDPTAGNAELFELARTTSQFRPVPAVHPGLPGWEVQLDAALANGAPCVRCDPDWYGLAPDGEEMASLIGACGVRGMPLQLTVRFEDGRQRHPRDTAPELQPSAVRALVRGHPAARLLITGADREFVEQVHFGSTPAEASRLLWDISWIWGPPEDHLELLLQTVGSDRFAFGSALPLRLAENAVAKLDLLELSAEERNAINRDNAAGFAARRG